MNLNTVKFSNVLLPVFVLAIGMLTLSSCQQEGCTDPLSDNFDPEATVDDGSCIPWREKFLGTYTAELECTGDNPEMGNLVATESSLGEDKILFTLNDLNIVATTITSTNLVIDLSTVDIQGEETEITGTGSLTNGTDLQLNFTLSSGPVNSICVLTATKL